MKHKLILLLLLLSIGLFAQEKSYRFLYDFHQITKLDRTENLRLSSEDFAVVVAELNRSYEVEVVANTMTSFIKVLEKVDNAQEKSFIKIEPEPKWLFNDFESALSYNHTELFDSYVKDSIQQISLQPTRHIKKILGFDAKKFTAEDEENMYNFWLVKNNDLTVSPLQFQLKGYIILEADVMLKIKNNLQTERKMTYILKDMIEDKTPFNFEKVKPKKVITKNELNHLLEETKNNFEQGVDRD